MQTESKNIGKTKKEKLAEKIANMILNSISENNELSENDFMILMQRRSYFANIIIEKLLEKN